MNTVKIILLQIYGHSDMLKAEARDKMLKTRFYLTKSLVIQIKTPQILTVMCVPPIMVL